MIIFILRFINYWADQRRNLTSYVTMVMKLLNVKILVFLYLSSLSGSVTSQYNSHVTWFKNEPMYS